MGPVEGATANLMLPHGLITSYKPKMWHGGRVEVIHSLVSEDENGEVMIHEGSPWMSDVWLTVDPLNGHLPRGLLF
ncbi:hypothetical protein KSP40_PGU017500 [Platanthera guangdongensis]|uniref:Uncharacterized protein n=1 Tax=Platanthera guangdongensis TaxID=2320717 RepID=A0ABR2MRG4_9ASPA